MNNENIVNIFGLDLDNLAFLLQELLKSYML